GEEAATPSGLGAGGPARGGKGVEEAAHHAGRLSLAPRRGGEGGEGREGARSGCPPAAWAAVPRTRERPVARRIGVVWPRGVRMCRSRTARAALPGCSLAWPS